ncbi:MAG TPA: M56 family metallopeptidase [Steroidobacteraceae bacterium]|nr:M56 family metallopeptidase [Steroidobacteraceae bacterium]
MMASFAAYQLLLSLLIGLAALAGEQMLLRCGQPRRFVWAAALCASLAFPLFMSLYSAPSPSSDAGALSISSIMPGPRSTVEPQQSPALAQVAPTSTVGPMNPALPVRDPGRSLATIIAIVWPTASVAVWLFYAFGSYRMMLITRASTKIVVFGTPVLLTGELGPAVFGIRRPLILWPRRLQSAAPVIQRAALAHEQAHLSARDPLLLAVALFLVSLAPWNPLLWWQLRRLRFAVEADCDVRVVRRAASASDYAEALWRMGRMRGTSGAGFAILMSAPTWLERRIRLVLRPPTRSRWRTAAAIPISMGLLIAAAWVHAPSLAASALRKLPPKDMRPAAGWAIAATRTQFPELLRRPFPGTAVVAAVFDREGHLKLAAQHRFAPGTAPSDFDMRLENDRLGIDPTEDVLYGAEDGANGGATIGPWLASRNPGRLFVVYEVLKWKPDPTRRRARVLAALKAYAPELFVKQTQDAMPPSILVAVFMNNDGTVSGLQKQIIPAGKSFTMHWRPLYAAMGVTRQQMGRRGSVAEPPLFINYAWARRADDAPDVAELDAVGLRIGAGHPPHTDTADDAAIAQRYFPDIVAKGRAAVTERVNGAKAQETPWILFGRDGKVWGTGRWHNDNWRFVTGPSATAIEARYPGTLVEGDATTVWRVRGVLISAMYVAPNSPIQGEASVPWSQRKDVLVSGEFFGRLHDRPPLTPSVPVALPFAFDSAQNFGSPGDVRLMGTPMMALTASPLGANEASLSVRLNVCEGGRSVRTAPPTCLRSESVRTPYDMPVEVPLSQDPQTQYMYTRILVRVQRLRT